jgi:Flp pilus assembly protein TadD
MAAMLKSAEIAVRRADHAKARRLFDRAIALSPRDPQPRLALVRYLAFRRDLNAALTAAGDCIRLQSGNADCVLLLGKIQTSMGKTKEALASFRRYAALAPQLPAAQLVLGTALSEAGDQSGAARAFQTAARLAPEAANVKLAQISFQLGQSKFNDALALARAYQSSYPGMESDLLLADTLYKAKQPGESLAVLEKSLSDRPSSAVLLRLVEIAKLAGDTSRADTLMRNWVTAHPADQAVRLNYAGFLLQQGANAQAIVQYRALLAQNPDSVLALNNLGWLIQRDDPKGARTLLTHAWTLAPESGAVADTLGWFKLQQKDAAGALPLLERAHAAQPGDGQISYHLAAALDTNGKKDAARNLLNTLLASGAKFQDRPAAIQLAATLKPLR